MDNTKRCPECGQVLYEIVEGSKYFCTYCDKFYDEDLDEIDAKDEDMMDDVPWQEDI